MSLKGKQTDQPVSKSTRFYDFFFATSLLDSPITMSVASAGLQLSTSYPLYSMPPIYNRKLIEYWETFRVTSRSPISAVLSFRGKYMILYAASDIDSALALFGTPVEL